MSYDRGPGGRLATITSGGSTIEFSYDADGHVISATSPGVRVTQTYRDGWLTAVATDVGGIASNVTRGVDALGRTTSVAVAGGATVGYTYDSTGALVTGREPHHHSRSGHRMDYHQETRDADRVDAVQRVRRADGRCGRRPVGHRGDNHPDPGPGGQAHQDHDGHRRRHQRDQLHL